jgi:DNA-binding LacI/PurR family transcriptional regulator
MIGPMTRSRQTGPDPGRQRVTLKDVAGRAAVSLSTASLVFSGRGPVAEATARRVRDAAAELGYAGPDPLASSLRHGRSGVVGVLVEGRLLHAFHDPFAVSVLDGLAGVLDDLGVGMLLIALDPGDPEGSVARIATHAVDAVVVPLGTSEGHPVLPHLAARGIPVVAAGIRPGAASVTLSVDERAASAAATSHLRGLGHVRIGTVTMQLSGAGRLAAVTARDEQAATYADATDRLAGFRSVAGRRAPAVQTPWPDVANGRVAAELLLDLPVRRRPTAVVAQSDLLAAGVVQAAEARGLRVPDDLSVVGFDGVQLPWLAHELTTVDQSGPERGRVLGDLTRRVLVGEPVEDVVLPTRLRVGTTTGPPPAASTR